jgi:hypothetical protein
MNIPIILVHKYDSSYLEYAVRAASKNNEDVTLITDIKGDKYNNIIKVINIDDYKNENSELFTSIYKHLSTNKFEFEFNAINKFFFMLEHMKKYNLKKILYIDSDVIIHENLSVIINQHFADYDICSCEPEQTHDSFLWGASAHILLCSFEALELFCKFILKIYSSDNAKINLKWKWHQQNNIPGGINDMTLLYLFQLESKLKIGNFLPVIDNTFCFDLAINSSTNMYENEYQMHYSFLMGRNLKKMIFRNNHPYSHNLLLKKDIRFCILHCQSDSKRIMQLLVRDKKNITTFLSDNFVTLKLFYSAIRRILSNLHSFIKNKIQK